MKLAAKAAAVLSAFAMLTAAAGTTVQAAETKVNIAIDKVVLDVDTLKEMEYRVPVKVMLNTNPGVNAIEFGVKVDDRCTYEIISRMGQDTPDGEMMIVSMTKSMDKSLSWMTWASADPMEETGALAYYYVIVPQDAAAGDKFTIDYCPQEYVTHLWNDTISGNRYVDLGEVSWENGSISITAGGKGEMMGDVNCDDTVNILDVLALNRNFLIGEKLTEAGTLNADVDGDGKPTSIDALMILKYTIHLIEAL